jgi:hypothetical protein
MNITIYIGTMQGYAAMEGPMSQLDITTIVAVVAVTGILALVLQVATYRRDRADVTVGVTCGSRRRARAEVKEASWRSGHW